MSEPQKYDPTNPFHGGYPHRCVKEKSVWHSDEGLKRCQWCSCEYEPFDLQRALAGEKVLVVGKQFGIQISQWSPENVELVHAPIAKVVILVHTSGATWTFNKDGLSSDGDSLLVMAPKPKRKVVAWVNLYQKGNPEDRFWSEFSTEDFANQSAKLSGPSFHRVGGRAYRIEYEEEI